MEGIWRNMMGYRIGWYGGDMGKYGGVLEIIVWERQGGELGPVKSNACFLFISQQQGRSVK